MHNNKLKTIILDLVGVVVNIDLERDDEALNAIGLPNFHGCMHHDRLRPILSDYLNGLTSETDFCNTIRPYCTAGKTDEDILQAMDEHLADIPKERLKMISEMKERFNVCLLTNIYRRAWEIVVRKMTAAGFSPADCFDRVFLSYEMHMAKPDRAIYGTVLRETGTEAHETVFIDDTPANVLAAKALGIHAFHIEMNTLDRKTITDIVQSIA